MDERPLPAWLPQARTLGGFYVRRALGAGAGGSVFVVNRVAERRDDNAERLALKVPDYSGSAARTLSEDEFMRMFRQEAGALLTVPAHPNIARFVTFDAGARPKPVLVMELVNGPTLQRVLAKGDMDCPRALDILDGIMAALATMHSVGVGHLDLKPSTVVLRETLPGQSEGPVLVDFGLAGRHIRPGCGSGAYGAPEVWATGQGDQGLSPMPADVYALGCVAYELMTGKVLFDAETETAMIAAHQGHDGRPDSVTALQRGSRAQALCQLDRSLLAHEPGQACHRGAIALRAEKAETLVGPTPLATRGRRAAGEPLRLNGHRARRARATHGSP